MRRSHVRIIYADVDDAPPLSSEANLLGPWWAWAGLLAIIGLISFAPAMTGTFLPQDDANVTENPFLPAWGSLRGIWRFFYHQPQASPLGYSLLMVESHLWGSTAQHAALGYHLVNLLLHTINAILLWTVLRRLDLPGAFVAAALFAAHPLQVQSVAWISQQPMLLGVTFALASLLVCMRDVGLDTQPYEPGVFRLPTSRATLQFIAAFLFLLAILSKPALAVLPVIVLAMIWWDRGVISRDDLRSMSTMLFISLVTLVAALAIAHRATPTAVDLTFGQRLQLAGPAIWFYLYAALRPLAGTFTYARWNPAAWWNIAASAAIVALVASLFFARHRIGRAPAAIAVVFILLLLPSILFLNVEQLRDSYVADSVAYAASAVVIAPFVALFATWLMQQDDGASRATVTMLAIASIGVAMIVSFRGSRAYQSAAALWKDTVERSPESVHALNQLGELQLASNHPAIALQHFRSALAIDPDRKQTHRNLGAYFETIGDPDRALAEYLSVLRRDPGDVLARCGLARTLDAKGDTTTAIEQYQKVLANYPDYEPVLNDLAGVYVESGYYDDALALYQRAIQINPRQPRTHVNLASLYLQLGKYQEAQSELATALQLNPRDFVAHTNAGAMYGKISELTPDAQQKKLFLDRSELHFRQAMFLNPESAVAAHNLALALARQPGKMNEAIYYFNRACQLDPANVAFKKHLDAAMAQAGKLQ